jgi:predicted DNA-binding transcriptional regulator YafY
MSNTDRLLKIQRILEAGKVVSAREFLNMFEVSRATFRRDLDYLRDRMGVPVIWDAEAGGYRIEANGDDASVHRVPGLWLNDKEIIGLLTVMQVLEEFEPATLIGEEIKPLRERLEGLLEQGEFSSADIRRRIRISRFGSRPSSTANFQVVAHALLKRRRLSIKHFSRLNAQLTEREVSPQRMSYYRDNWYLDAFCHRRNDLRSFSIDALDGAIELDKVAVIVDEKTLSDELESGYGIFAGGERQIAKLKFTPFRARWVAKEVWHIKQKGKFLDDGAYLLEIPYSDERELLHDILRQGREVEVMAPESLRVQVTDEIKAMSNLYLPSLA